MKTIPPVVLIEIDQDSRLRILQSDGVVVGFVDLRVDSYGLIVLPTANRAGEINDRIERMHILSIDEDDPVKTAAHTLLRLARRQVVVVGLKEVT